MIKRHCKIEYTFFAVVGLKVYFNHLKIFSNDTMERQKAMFDELIDQRLSQVKISIRCRIYFSNFDLLLF